MLQKVAILEGFCVVAMNEDLQTTPEEFEHEDFTLKAHHMFSVLTTPKVQRRRSWYNMMILTGDDIVFEKLRFRAGLVRTVGLTVEIKLRFQFSPA